jgi:hypothetical protein
VFEMGLVLAALYRRTCEEYEVAVEIASCIDELEECESTASDVASR